MRQQHAVVVLLVHDRVAVDDVQRDAVRQLDQLERRLLGEHLVDVRGQEGVGREDRVADRALDGGFEFLFGGAVEACKRGEGQLGFELDVAGEKMGRVVGDGGCGGSRGLRAYSFLNMVDTG